jgi:hypothetical protein
MELVNYFYLNYLILLFELNTELTDELFLFLLYDIDFYDILFLFITGELSLFIFVKYSLFIELIDVSLFTELIDLSLFIELTDVSLFMFIEFVEYSLFR